MTDILDYFRQNWNFFMRLFWVLFAKGWIIRFLFGGGGGGGVEQFLPKISSKCFQASIQGTITLVMHGYFAVVS